MTGTTRDSILIVDDDPSICELLSVFLSDLGYTVTTSGDGAKALELLRSAPPDLVLLDLDLPGMNGLDVLRHLRSEKIPTKVIAISGHAAALDYLGPDGVKLGAETFLTKPLDLGQLELEIAAELSSTERPPTRVLVADDDPVICELLRLFLEEKGYAVLVANDGEAALRSVREERPDVLLLDLNMPELSGVEVLQHLQSDENRLATIVISGAGDEDSARASLKLGAADFITKPLDLEYLEFSLLAKLISLGV